MRHLVLSEDGQRLVQNAYQRLLVTCSFPDSPRDQQQALIIAALEKAEFDRVGEANYQPSEIAAAAIKLVENRNAQVYLAGFVGMVHLWLAMNGQKPSLNRAAIITACAADEFGQVVWHPALDPTGQQRARSATSDPATLERIFRQYRSVAHICAARVSASEYLAPLHVWDESPDLVKSLVQSCAIFQGALENVTNVREWNMWDVIANFPVSLRDWPPLDKGDQLMAWFATGYQLAIDRGLFKRPR